MLLSFTFNGVKKDFVIAEKGKRRSAFAPIARNLITVPKVPGAYLQNSETEVRTIEQPILIKGVNRYNVRKLEEELASWLVTSQPKELIFDDEPDRIYYAIVQGSVEIEDVVDRWGRGFITFICLDPYKYRGMINSSEFLTNPTNLFNNGSVSTYPVFRANVLQPITNLDLIMEDVYMRIGQPYKVEEVPAEAETAIFHDTLSSLTGWSQADHVDNGNISGEIRVMNNNTFYPALFGTVIESGKWQGPSLKKSFSEPIQDFRMETELQITNTQGKTGMIEIYLLDASNNTVGKIGIEDYYTSTTKINFKARAGDVTDGDWIVSHEETGWNDFNGMIRLEREGLDWYAYIGKWDESKQTYVLQLGSKRNIYFHDTEAKYTAPIAQIQIAFRMFAGHGDPCPMYVHRVRVWRKNIVQVTEIPYIAEPGDLIEIDHANNDIRINGFSRIDLKDFGGTFFPLDPGDNPIFYYPEEAVDLSVDWRERFL